MIRIDGFVPNGIAVTVTRTIEVGKTMKINPSEGYLGIESGNITVLAIEPYYTLEGDVRNQAEEFSRVLLECFDGLDENDLYQEEEERLRIQPWVVYQYGRNGDVCTLPLQEFVEHSMPY